jgi:hypothetical protein
MCHFESGVVVHAHSCSIQEAEACRLRVQSQPGQHSKALSLFFFFQKYWVWTQGLCRCSRSMEPLCQPFYVGNFQDGVLGRTICPGCLWTSILNQEDWELRSHSASWVARITDVSLWHPAMELLLKVWGVCSWFLWKNIFLPEKMHLILFSILQYIK